MTDLRRVFRAELEELESMERAAPRVDAARMAARVERTLSARRRARTLYRASALAAVAAAVIVVGLGARRSRAVDAASDIAREPISPSQLPTAPLVPAATTLPASATSSAADPAKTDPQSPPRGADRADPMAPRGPEKPSRPPAEPSAEELLERALSARAGGNVEAATDLLVTLRKAHPGTSQAAIAAAYLGRDAARSGRRDAARRWFETYLQEQPTGPLAREASGQLIELTTGAEQTERARRYLAEHPNGPHAPLATRVLAGAQ
ncbi:MAG: hypothetical protein JST00_32205 [Deltaproteobacteria bacterium]|nr:hypothetical protein [Deltaproteobacteria bacterium]